MKQKHWTQTGIIIIIVAAALFYGGLFILYPSKAHAATARFTGYFEVTRTSNGRPALNCQYAYGGMTYWYMVPGSRCPRSIQVP